MSKEKDEYVDSKFSIIAIIIAITASWFWFTDGPGAKQPIKPTEQNKKNDANLNRGLAGALMLKNSMRDPDSLKIEKAILPNHGKSSCYEYRANNGFGGFNVGKAVLIGDGIALITNEQAGFLDQWSSLCADKAGRNFTAEARYIIN